MALLWSGLALPAAANRACAFFAAWALSQHASRNAAHTAPHRLDLPTIHDSHPFAASYAASTCISIISARTTLTLPIQSAACRRRGHLYTLLESYRTYRYHHDSCYDSHRRFLYKRLRIFLRSSCPSRPVFAICSPATLCCRLSLTCWTLLLHTYL